MSLFWRLLSGCCGPANLVHGLDSEPVALPRFQLPLTGFEIGMMLTWVDEGAVNMELGAALQKLHGAMDDPIHHWVDNWQDTMDEATALQKLHAALNPTMLEFTIPELKAILIDSQRSPRREIGSGGQFQLPEEKFLLEKLQSIVDRAAANNH